MVRDFLATIIALLMLAIGAAAVANQIWPPDPHPLLIDAASPNCRALPTPLPRGMGPPRAPLSDSRRIA